MDSIHCLYSTRSLRIIWYDMIWHFDGEKSIVFIGWDSQSRERGTDTGDEKGEGVNVMEQHTDTGDEQGEEMSIMEQHPLDVVWLMEHRPLKKGGGTERTSVVMFSL